jgi:hypothetical protein
MVVSRLVEGRGFRGYGKKSLEALVRVERRFSAASKPFRLIIPNRLQPVRDLRFRLFPQPL